MKEKNISKDYKTVCVDNNKDVPSNVKKVPAIIDSSLNDILIGDKAFDYISSLQYFNFPTNNFQNWSNKNIPKPDIKEDEKAFDEMMMKNNKEDFNISKAVEMMKKMRQNQDANFNK